MYICKWQPTNTNNYYYPLSLFPASPITSYEQNLKEFLPKIEVSMDAWGKNKRTIILVGTIYDYCL